MTSCPIFHVQIMNSKHARTCTLKNCHHHDCQVKTKERFVNKKNKNKKKASKKDKEDKEDLMKKKKRTAKKVYRTCIQCPTTFSITLGHGAAADKKKLDSYKYCDPCVREWDVNGGQSCANYTCMKWCSYYSDSNLCDDCAKEEEELSVAVVVAEQDTHLSKDDTDVEDDDDDDDQEQEEEEDDQDDDQAEALDDLVEVKDELDEFMESRGLSRFTRDIARLREEDIDVDILRNAMFYGLLENPSFKATFTLGFRVSFERSSFMH